MQEDKDPQEVIQDSQKLNGSKNIGLSAMINNTNMKNSFSRENTLLTGRNTEWTNEFPKYEPKIEI
jgi:hypothetical protein